MREKKYFKILVNFDQFFKNLSLVISRGEKKMFMKINTKKEIKEIKKGLNDPMNRFNGLDKYLDDQLDRVESTYRIYPKELHTLRVAIHMIRIELKEV